MCMVLAAFVSTVVVAFNSRPLRGSRRRRVPTLILLSRFLPTAQYSIASLLPLSRPAYFPASLHTHQSDPRRLLCPATGMLIYKGQFTEGSACPPLVVQKIREEAERPAVGIVRMVKATSKMEGGLPAYLRRAGGLRILANITKRFVTRFPQMAINLKQGDDDPEVLEITLGQCNTGNCNFNEHLSELKTVKMSDSGEDVARGNINFGGCSRRINSKGARNCRLLRDYPQDQVDAMQQTAVVLYEMVSESFRDSRVLLVQKFGNVRAGEHRRDGKPVVKMEATTTGGMVVLSCMTKHLSLAPGDMDALRSTVEDRLALKAPPRQSWGAS